MPHCPVAHVLAPMPTTDYLMSVCVVCMCVCAGCIYIPAAYVITAIISIWDRI